jgi:hypothetical protein
MGSKRKRLNELHMEKKNEVLDLIDRGVSERTVAVQFGVANCSAGNKQNRGTVLKAWEEHCSSDRQRKLRRTDNDNVNAVTLHLVRLLDKCYWTNVNAVTLHLVRLLDKCYWTNVNAVTLQLVRLLDQC